MRWKFQRDAERKRRRDRFRRVLTPPRSALSASEIMKLESEMLDLHRVWWSGGAARHLTKACEPRCCVGCPLPRMREIYERLGGVGSLVAKELASR